MKPEHAELVERLDERAMALGRAKNPSTTIDDVAVHFMQAAQAIRSLSAEVEEAEGLLTEIRQWMDAEMGEWDAKFIAKIAAFLTRKEKDID